MNSPGVDEKKMKRMPKEMSSHGNKSQIRRSDATS